VLFKLLVRHLSSVQLLYRWGSSGAAAPVTKYSQEYKLPFTFVADCRPEVIAAMKANAQNLSDSGGSEREALMRQARAEKVPVRIVDVREYVTPARA
jgi:hypothetical protein